MKVTPHTDGHRFTLLAETDADQQLIDTLYVENTVRLDGPPRASAEGAHVDMATLVASRSDPRTLEAQAASQLLHTFTQLFRLGLGQQAVQWHVRANATDPDTKHQLAAGLEQLQLVLQALRVAVSHHESIGQAVVGAHGDPHSRDESAIVRNGSSA